MTTIEAYLKGFFSFEFSDANLTSILLKRGIAAGADQATVSTDLKELCQADMYMVMFNYFGQATESVSKGNWKRSTGGIVVGVNDRKSFLDAANTIYKKYGESTTSYNFIDRTNAW